MLEYVVSQTTGDDFIITLMSGDYKGVAVKVVDLKFDESGELDFEIELPKNKAELFTDEAFKEEVGLIVGEIVKKSIDAMYKTQEDIATLEESVGEILKKHNVKRDEDTLLIEQFMAKGFLLKLDKVDNNDKIVAVDVKENKFYDLENETDFEFVRKRVFQNIILN